MKTKNLRNSKSYIIFLIFVFSITAACKNIAVPKPKGYFRIDLPGKKYTPFNETGLAEKIPLKFEYPAYGKITDNPGNPAEPGWFNIEFPLYKARIYLTYKNINNDLAELIEQTYAMNVKNHINKADAINEYLINDREERIYGILYDLKGNTATSVQFYVTDSLKHYLRGSLYFDAVPNADSLAPLIDFFREDIIHLVETLEWEKN